MSLAAKGHAPLGAYRGKAIWITGASQAWLGSALVALRCTDWLDNSVLSHCSAF